MRFREVGEAAVAATIRIWVALQGSLVAAIQKIDIAVGMLHEGEDVQRV